MGRVFMARLFWGLCTAVVLPVCVFGQGRSFTLDGALAESMDYIAGKLPEKTKVAVLKVKAPNEELTDYISVECDNYIKDNTNLVLANKKTLPDILKRNNIADLNKASEEDAIKVGLALGAKAVVFVGFDKRDGNYRFFIQMYDTETAHTNGMLALDVELDGLLADFTGEVYISPEKRREMEKDEELARIKKELEETEAHNAKLQKEQENIKLQKEQEAAKSQKQSDFDAAFSELEARKKGGGDTKSRLESEMAQRKAQPVVQKNEPSVSMPKETKEKENGKYFVFSLRPEFFTVIGGATAVGADVELGHIGKSGFYFSTDFNGGARYWGGGFNFGGCINKDGRIKNVIGFEGGLWNAVIKVYGKSDTYDRFYMGTNYLNLSWGGGFWKFLFGGNKGNFDITDKILFGRRDDILSGAGWHFNATYSLSAGYTLMKKKGK